MTVNWQVQTLASTPSTQDVVHDLALDGAPSGTVIQAMKQESARGRHGKIWQAPMGNLYMSLLLRPQCEIAQAGELAFVVAVALSNALDEFIDTKQHKKTLKWPNDVLVNGLKISGILLETNLKDESLDNVVIGIGLNIFNAPDFAVCLNDVAKDPVYVNVVRDKVLMELASVYDVWQAQGIAPIRLKWLSKAHGLGQTITARLSNETHKGVFEGLSEDGALILKMDNDERKFISAGEVHFAAGD